MLYAFLVQLALAALAVQWVHGRIRDVETRPLPASTSPETVAALAETVRELSAAHDQLEEAVSQQTIAIAEGIERAERAERRVRASVQRARAKLREHGLESDALDAEAAQLREDDGGRSREGGMQPMPAHMANGAAAPDSEAQLSFLKRVVPGMWTPQNVAQLLGR